MDRMIKCSLLIDDDKPTSCYNKYLLLKHSAFAKVNVVYSGYDGLTYLNNIKKDNTIKPDVIFLDINMPAMSGWDFLIEYSKLEEELISGIKVFLLSTSNDPNDYRRYLDCDIVLDFVNKPLSFGALNKIIEQHFYLIK